MIPPSRNVIPQSRGLICITLLAVLLFLASAGSVSATDLTVYTTINPNHLVLQPTLTLVPLTMQIPLAVQTVRCTAPAECMYPSEATATWGPSGFTQSTELPCFYDPAMVTAPTTKYCYQKKGLNQVLVTTLVPETYVTPTPVVQTTSCTAPAECIYRSEAAVRWGESGFWQSAELPYFYDPTMVVAPTTKYCYQSKTQLIVAPDTPVPGTIPTTKPVQTVTTKVTTKPTTSVPVQTTTSPGNCPGKQAPCNGFCTDIFGSDKNNCGGCGWACPDALICSQGECIADCPAGFDTCRQYDCTDLRNDDNNCGECGTTCGLHETCQDSKCRSLCSVDPSTLNYFSWADWQGGSWMTPVKDQGACGSCWAEAPTGAVEAVYNIETSLRSPAHHLNLSEQALVSGCYGDLGSCSGGDQKEALEVLKTKGVAEDIFMPYQSSNCAHDDGKGHLVCNADIVGHCSNPSTCTLKNVPANHIWKITKYMKETDDYAWTDNEEVDTIKEAILCRGPLTACSGNWWHCVDIVGWQGSYWEANGGWIVRNSWGTGWGSNGYGILKYGEPLSKDEKKQLYGDIAMDAWSVKGVYHG